jgi:quercetin dioxygenase-like cupin family protein
MAGRTAELQRFIDGTEAAIMARAADYPDAMAMAARVFSALRTKGGDTPGNPPARLGACGHLDRALGQARNSPGGPGPIAELADAFAALEPAFTWHRRLQSDQEPGGFHDSHANAIIVGKGGLEERSDALIGLSLVAPEMQYPRHRHPPEEIYLVLSPGQWMQNDTPMAARQSGDLVHNPPNTWHAMRAMEEPLLAVWCLWLGH